MPKLTALTVENLWKGGEPLRRADADCPGLYFQVSGVKSASWLLRYALDGKRVEMGLGPYPLLGLAQAREKARTERRVARVEKIDPLLTRRAEQSRKRAELAKLKTVRQLVEEYAEVKSHGWSAGTTKRFRLDFANHVLPVIGDMLARDVNVANVKTVLDPIWLEKPALSRALQNHIAGIWDYAMFYGIAPLNPARNLQRFLAKQPKTTHRQALPFEQMPEFFRQLHEYQLSQALTDPRYDKPNREAAVAMFESGKTIREIAAEFGVSHLQTIRIWIGELRPGLWRGKCHDRPRTWVNNPHRNWNGPPPSSLINYRKLAAHAFEFMILLGPLRTSETLATTWGEIDEDRKLLTIPRSRMKNKKARNDHIVPLSDRAMAIIEKMKAIRHNDFLFPGSALTNRKKLQDRKWTWEVVAGDKIGCPLDKRAFITVLRDRFPHIDATPHGFRTTFTNWAYASRSFRDIAIELSLDHAYGNQVHRAYRDERLVEERRELLQAWSDYCNGRTADIIRLPTPGTRTA